jgi:uncharacterized protein YjdB
VNRYSTFAVLIAGLGLLAGCGSNTNVGTIQISPPSQSLAAGQTAQFTATGIITHGKHPSTTQDVTTMVTWETNAPAIATISSTGMATGVSAGTATLTASMPGSISASATITVTSAGGGGGGGTPPEPLVSLAVIPNTQTALVVNETAAFFAIGTTSSGATVDLTNKSATVGSATIKPAAWTSTIPGVASVDSVSGIAIALASGSTSITATAKNPDGTIVTGSATLTVNISSPGSGEPLVSVALVPGAQTLTVANQNAAFIAIGTTASGTTVNLTNQPVALAGSTINAAVWNSSSPGVATINPSTGQATAVSNGVTVITAIASNPDGTVVTGTGTLTVNIPSSPEPLVSLAIVPNAETLTSANQNTQLIAIGTTGTGATVNLTNQSATVATATIKAAAWTSSNPSVAAVNPVTGIATALSNGVTVLTAIASNPDGTVVTGTTTLTVNISPTQEPLVSLAIVPGAQTATAVNQTAQFIAIGTTSAGTTVNLTNQTATINGVTIAAASWASSSTAVATINSASGLAKAVGGGVVAITAVAKNPDGTVVTAASTFTVSTKPEPLVSLAIVPGTQTLNETGQSAQFIAIGTTASGATVNLTNTTANIDAATNLAATTIQPAKWASSTMAVATIDPATGLATAGTSGTTVITAIASNPDGTVVTGTATLTVNANPEPLASMAVTPSSQQVLAINQSVQFISIAVTSSGATVNLTGQTATVGSALIKAAAWSSSNPNVAAVDPATGIATALNVGTTAITAIATNPDGTVVTGTAALTVTTPNVTEPLVSMAILPSTQTLALLNQPANLKAIATTGSGTTVDLTNNWANVGGVTINPAVWSSSNEKVATVNPGTGVVIAVTAGTTAITAIANNPDGTVVTGTAVVTVTATGGPGGPYVSITVLPGTQAVPWPNATTQFMAIGTTATGATSNLTSLVKWSTSSSQIATIGQSTGLATAVNQGTATVTALFNDPSSGNLITGNASFTVASGTFEPYSGITILPGNQTLSASGQNAQLVALGAIGSTGGSIDVTNSPQIKWISSVPTIASVSSGLASGNGIVTGASVGTTTITAILSNPDGSVVSAIATITAIATPAPSPLLSLSIIPNTISVGDLQDTGQFLAIGTFSTAPYVQDVTNSPNTTWLSSFPDDFPVSTNSGGTPSASAGIVTAYASGSATIIAEYTDPLTKTIQTAMATFNCPLQLPDNTTHPPTPGSCWTGQSGPLKATLTIIGEGLNTTNWLITAPSATATPDVIHCGPGWTANGGTGGSVCTGIYPVGTTVILTAPAQSGVAFGGWTNNCTPSDPAGNPLPGPIFWTAAGPNYCTVTLTSISGGSVNATVGAIFNNQ